MGERLKPLPILYVCRPSTPSVQDGCVRTAWGGQLFSRGAGLLS